MPGDPDGTKNDVFWNNLSTGRTRQVSINPPEDFDSGSFRPDLSASGRFVVFESDALNLGGSGAGDVYRRDMRSNTITLLSHAPDGTGSNNVSRRASISARGTSIAYDTAATNLVPTDTGPSPDVLLWQAP